MLGKLASAQEPAAAAAGLYLVLFSPRFIWSILAGLAACSAGCAASQPRVMKLASARAVVDRAPNWSSPSCRITPPLYPAIAILIAGAVDRMCWSRRPWLVRGAAWWFSRRSSSALPRRFAALQYRRARSGAPGGHGLGRHLRPPAGGCSTKTTAPNGRFCGDRAAAWCCWRSASFHHHTWPGRCFLGDVVVRR